MWNFIGYTGSILILLSFVMVTRSKWAPQSLAYLLVSLLGALLLAVYQIRLGAFAGVLLNVVFAGVAVWGILSHKPKKGNKE